MAERIVASVEMRFTQLIESRNYGLLGVRDTGGVYRLVESDDERLLWELMPSYQVVYAESLPTA